MEDKPSAIAMGQAYDKAKQLWGETACVVISGPHFMVGEVVESGQHFYGIGSSWDLAFKNAAMSIN